MIARTHLELEVEIEFDHVPGERETRDCPGSPEEVEITNVTILQNNSALMLTPDQVVQVETEIWKKLAEK